MKFLYTNMEMNLPHHLSYVAALPCKCTQRIMHVKPLTFCTNKHQTLFRQTCGIQISHIWTKSITRSGLSCKVVSIRQKSVAMDERRVIDVWCGLEQLDYQHGFWPLAYRRLRACIHSKGGPFEHNLWTGDINFLSICVTFVWMLPCCRYVEYLSESLTGCSLQP